MDLEQWLTDQGLEEHLEVFVENRIEVIRKLVGAQKGEIFVQNGLPFVDLMKPYDSLGLIETPRSNPAALAAGSGTCRRGVGQD